MHQLRISDVFLGLFTVPYLKLNYQFSMPYKDFNCSEKKGDRTGSRTGGFEGFTALNLFLVKDNTKSLTALGAVI